MLTIRTAEVSDAPEIAAIGSVAFRAVHDSIIGPEIAASVVEQTYSIEALTACITLCATKDDAHFLVACEGVFVVGYLHYDCEGPQPELHRLYIDPARKRGGIGRALLRELHARLTPGSSYVLLVAELNTDARAFYDRQGFVFDARVIGNEYYMQTMGTKDEPSPPPYDDRALVLRITLPG
jgi:ribosomal protein S18 acetylase RimI-like enzyme